MSDIWVECIISKGGRLRIYLTGAGFLVVSGAILPALTPHLPASCRRPRLAMAITRQEHLI